MLNEVLGSKDPEDIVAVVAYPTQIIADGDNVFSEECALDEAEYLSLYTRQRQGELVWVADMDTDTVAAHALAVGLAHHHQVPFEIRW